MVESNQELVAAKNVTAEEKDDLAADTWSLRNIEKGRRRDCHLKILGAAGQRGGELSQLRIQQMRVLDFHTELRRYPDSYNAHPPTRNRPYSLGGDTRTLRWLAQEKAAGLQDRARCITRAPEVSECPISALALHLSYQMDIKPRACDGPHFGSLLSELIEGQEVLMRWGNDPDRQGMLPTWWATHLFYGSGGIECGLKKNTLYKEVEEALRRAGITDKSAVQHLFRYARVRILKVLGGAAALAAGVPWAGGKGSYERVYSAVSPDLEGTMSYVFGPKWRDFHVSGRCSATWALLEKQEWLADPALAHLTGIPEYVAERLFSGELDAAVRAFPDERDTHSSRAVIDVFLWLRESFMQDLPFWLQTRGDHAYFQQHPLFADDVVGDRKGHFKQWLEAYWCPLVMRRHAEGLAWLEELRAPITEGGIRQIFAEYRDAVPNSPEEKDKRRKLARAVVGCLSPVRQPVMPQPTRRQLGDKVGLTLVRRPTSVREVMDEYLYGLQERPPLRAYMTNYLLDRSSGATWDPPTCKNVWSRRKDLVQGVLTMAERLRGGLEEALARLDAKFPGQAVGKIETAANAKKADEQWAEFLRETR